MIAEQQTFEVEEMTAPKPPKVAKKVAPKTVNENLEDCGVRGIPTPQERLRTYQQQSKGMGKKLRAKFWLGVLDSDKEVAKLCRANGSPPPKKRGRPAESENVPNRNGTGLIDENGVSQ